MSVLQPWVYTEELRIKQIADSLGGSVWVAESLLHWRPEDSDKHITVPYHPLVEPFDPEEFADRVRAAWAANGCRV